MKNTSKNSRVRVPTIFIMLILLGAAWGAYRAYPKSTPEVFLVTNANYYGDQQLEGLIQKNSANGVEGLFFLTTTDNNIIQLNISDIDMLIGQKAIVKGYVNPPTDASQFPIMIVTSIELK